jgi:glutamine synthetase
MKDNETITTFLGESFVEKYIHAKNEEWDEFRTHVTDWELKKYLNTI